MLIGKKLNFLIIGVIAAIFLAIAVFVVTYIPVSGMNAEKDSLFMLDAALAELRAEINKLDSTNFDGQIKMIKEKNDLLIQQFERLDKFKYLNADPDIAEALRVISRLYSHYEVNYEQLLDTSESIGNYLKEIFLSGMVKLNYVKESTLLQRSGQKDDVTALIDNVETAMSIIDNNLSSTHSVAVEQFELINKIIEKRERRAYLFGLVLIAAAGILAFFGALTIASRISKNIRQAGSGIERMSSGDLSRDFNISSKDEIGELGKNLNTLTESLKSAFKSMKASSNRGVSLKEELIASANQTSAASAQIASNSQAIAKQFTMLAERVSGASDANQSMKQGLKSLEELVREQTAMVEESTASVTEMISSVNSVTDITTRKKAATSTLVDTAEKGGAKLGATIKVINEINESLDQIKGAATIIQQISSQTNLLAMNAAIEAAHAGDAGRGFAVVADEIRKLAEASSINSKQINGVIKEVVNRIEVASESGRETEAAFTAIDREVEGVALSLDEISSSMAELNIGGRQILEAMTNLQEVSTHVNQGSREMSDASEKVTEAIEVVSRITTEVSESADEISRGISEVSSAMMLVTDLSGDLGEITDTLEEEAAQFITELDEAAEDSGDTVVSESRTGGTEGSTAGTGRPEAAEALVPGEESTGVTLSDEETQDVKIEDL